MEPLEVAPLWPTIREFVNDAVAHGCDIRMVDGKRCVCREVDGKTIVVDAPEEDENFIRLTPTVAASNYRVLLIATKGTW